MSNSSLFTPALLRTHSFVFFAVYETRNILLGLNPFISKASRRVSSFFLRVHLSQPYVATGHTSAFISRIFVEIGMLWLFHIFYSDAPIACPLFNLVRNSVVHSPSFVISDPGYGNVSTCSSSSFWMSMRHKATEVLLRYLFDFIMSLYCERSTVQKSKSATVVFLITIPSVNRF